MPIDFGEILPLVSEKTRAAHGFRTNLAADTEYTVWSGTANRYVWPSDSGEPMELVSDNAGDIGMLVLVSGLNTDGEEVNLVAQLNGTTPVLLSEPLFRVNRMLVFDTTAPVGEVSLNSVGGANQYSLMPAGDNASSQLVFTVPSTNRALFLSSETTLNKEGIATKATTIMHTYIRRYGMVQWKLGRWGLHASGTSAFVFQNADRPILQPRTDIEITVIASVNDSDVSGRMPFRLIKL